MTKEQILEDIIWCAVEVVGVINDDPAPATTLTEAGLTDGERLLLAAECEGWFELDPIPANLYAKWQTFGDIVDYIHGKLNG